MGTSTGYIMTISNSIIGVSVLAMPFCYQQCGILLSSILLLLSNVLSRSTCHFLLKSAIMSRRRNYEFLAFHIFGSTGKTFVELSIIGFMMGTCIAFFVVMADLGPAILSNVFQHIRIETLRPTVLMCLALFIVLPLGLLRNVESLSAISAATILFYLCLVLKVIAESSSHLLQGEWVYEVKYWSPSGLLQCLPIFSMALFCQTQLFDIFESMPNLSLDRMNSFIGSAINMCTGVYMSVGFFGYVAYYKFTNLSGNVLLSFSPNLSSEIIKFGFVLSVAVSFPLVIFPCRASIYSLLFRKPHTPHYESLTTGSNHIPVSRFRCITLFIITMSLITAMMIPNIELVLGLVGSTIGILICVLLPTYIFVTISSKQTTERLFAQVLFVAGILVMILGTYANLFATEKAMMESGSVSVAPVLANMNNKDEIMQLEESISINKKFMLQEMEGKIEKPIDIKNKQRATDNNKLESYKLNKIVNNNENSSIIVEANKEKESIGKIQNELDKTNKRNINEKENNAQENFAAEKIGDTNEIKIDKIINETNNNNELKKEKVLKRHNDDDVKINKEAMIIKEKEIQNEEPIISKLNMVNDDSNKNRELEILEKLNNQEKEQKKILKQQEIILNEVIKQNKKLEEIKQNEKLETNSRLKKIEVDNKLGVNNNVGVPVAAENILASDNNKNNREVSVGIGNKQEVTNNKNKIVTIGESKIGVPNSQMNSFNSTRNNIDTKNERINQNNQSMISNQIQELNNEIKKLNKEEVKITNQINKIEDNINLNNNINGAIESQNNLEVDRSNKNKKEIEKRLKNEEELSINKENETPLVNNQDKNGNFGSDKENNISHSYDPNKNNENFLQNNQNINQPPPQQQHKNPPEYIEIKKDVLPNTKQVMSGIPIPLILHQKKQEQSQQEKEKSIDIIKTRDILENVQREKRDVRIEPVNPIPPEYEKPVPSKINIDNLIDKINENILQDNLKELNNNEGDSNLINREIQKIKSEEINGGVVKDDVNLNNTDKIIVLDNKQEENVKVNEYINSVGDTPTEINRSEDLKTKQKNENSKDSNLNNTNPPTENVHIDNMANVKLESNDLINKNELNVEKIETRLNNVSGNVSPLESTDNMELKNRNIFSLSENDRNMDELKILDKINDNKVMDKNPQCDAADLSKTNIISNANERDGEVLSNLKIMKHFENNVKNDLKQMSNLGDKLNK